MPPALAQSRHQIDLAKPEFKAMRREFILDRASIDEEKRTVALSFASENPIARWFGNEVLQISPDACDLTRLNTGGAVLINHDWDDQVGVTLESSLDMATKKARTVAKFSRSERGVEIFNDILDGIRSLVSVGYIVQEMVLQSVEDGVETYLVTRWQPIEVSIVAVPADISVGVGRSQPTVADPASNPEKTTSTRVQPAPIMPTENPAASAVVPASSTVAVNEIAGERQRIKDLNTAATTIAGKYPAHADAIRALASKCAETGDGLDAFNRTVLNDILATQRTLAPVTQDRAAGSMGLSKKDVKRYSLMRAIRAKLENRNLDGIEGECNAELINKLERQPLGFFVPDEILADRRRGQRTLMASSPADGGFTVPEEILASEFVSFLRSNSTIVGLGARYLSGLKGDISIPRALTGAVAYWVSESGSITSSGATFGQIVGKPRRIGTSVPYTKQFLAQTSLDAETFVVNDSDEATGADLDRVAIRGIGGVEPLGILNLASADLATGVTFSAAATWPKYLSFWQNVADAKAIFGSPAYLTSPASAVKAQSIAKFTNTSNPIWDENDKIGSFKAAWSNNIVTTGGGTKDQVIFGDFSQVMYLEWAGRDVVVDPYGTNATSGTVTITIQRLIDMVIRRAKSFSISSDSGAQ
jgi:HK97 family phage major capsid protein